MAPGPPGDTVLRAKDGTEIQASALWADGPVLVVCLRRPGCLLCREEAVHLWTEREKFEALGVRMVVVVHEWREAEVAAFHPAYWGGELYFDPAKAFHAAVHGGRVRRGNIFDLLNPFSRAWRNMKRAKESGTVTDHNLVGDGMTLGGVMVFRQGGELAYCFPEETFGDHAPFEELLAGAKAATKA